MNKQNDAKAPSFPMGKKGGDGASLSDEELILRMRCGLSFATKEMAERYFNRKDYFLHVVGSTLLPYLTAWECNYAYFSAYESALGLYEFGQGYFRNYFLSSLKHELLKAINKKDLSLMSLSHPLRDASTLSLSDVLVDHNDLFSGLREWNVNLQEIGKSKGIPPKVLETGRRHLLGENFVEIAAALDLNPKTASKYWKEYIAFAKKEFELDPQPVHRSKTKAKK